jgi:hypothetical protein
MRKKTGEEKIPSVEVADKLALQELKKYYDNIIKSDLHRMLCQR